jgi:NAD(P)-dependent dehydrogenase (short-subunit alcohol dehydrogenase family)
MRKIAIITGASRGIGAATAIRLASDGFDVCVNYLRRRDTAESVAEIVRSKGAKALAVLADISDETQVKMLFEQVGN